MKRFRVKLVGFGFAALAGSAVAADGNWALPDGPPAVVAAGGEPVVLPDAVRFASASEPAPAVNPLWLPARSAPAAVVPPATRPVEPPAPLPDLRPQPSPVVARPIEPAAGPGLPPGPRVGAVPIAPETVRDVPEWLPPTPANPQRGFAESPAPIPSLPGLVQPPGSDTPVPGPGQVKPMPEPTPPSAIRPRPADDLPAPRPLIPAVPTTSPAVKELPVAPPEMMVPDCVPGKHGTFGSMPIRLSDDYPSLGELCGKPIRDRVALRRADGRPDGTRGFVQGEYLLWWVPGIRIPVLGTTNPDPNSFGFLGEPGTVSLLGPGNILGGTRQGVRVRGGLWLNDGSCLIDGSIFVLGRRSFDTAFSSSQFGIITRPIFSPNIQPGIGGVIGESGEAVTVPNVLAGSLSVNAESFLWGADANARLCLHSACDRRLMGFFGYRYLNLQEELSITENILVVGTSPRVVIPDPVGTVILVRDTFKTENHFNGGQVGVTYEQRRGRWNLDARASVALGATRQELDITGVQVRTRPGQPPMTFNNGGLLAAGPNLGRFTRDRFSVVPEVTLNVGFWVTPNLKAYVGYNFLYWSNVIRPGDQIDRVVDLTFVPNAPPAIPSGQLRPAPLFRQTDMIVNGMQFGVEWRW